METIRDYITHFNNVTFEESPFNDVDNVIFSALVYLHFDDILKKPMTLRELGKKFFNEVDYKKLKNEPIVVRRTVDNFEKIFNGKRYGDLIVSDYIKTVDKQKQFCAMKFKHKDFIYIAYEGTDDSVIGWKEDFEMIYKFPVSSQTEAIKYINRVIKIIDKNVIVGGHSKGGNLAMTASMYAKNYIRKKIIKVYNNDGPGFRTKQISSYRYRQMLSKLTMFVPEDALVGFILRHPNNYKVIKSSGRGMFQHNLNNWKCYGPILLEGELSKSSKDVDKMILNWLNRHDDIKREQMVNTIFDSLKECDITYFKQFMHLKLVQLIKIIRVSKNIDKESKDLVISAFKVIFFKNDSNI